MLMFPYRFFPNMFYLITSLETMRPQTTLMQPVIEVKTSYFSLYTKTIKANVFYRTFIIEIKATSVITNLSFFSSFCIFSVTYIL